MTFVPQLAIQEADTHFESISEPLAFYQNVSPTKELRDASNESESKIRDFGVESSMRLDVFNAKVAAEKNIKESGEWDKLSPEEQRLVEKMVCWKSCASEGCTYVPLITDRFWMENAPVSLYLRRRGMNSQN